MTTQVTYQGIEYTVADGETVDDLLKKKGFAEAHEQNMLEMTSELVAPTPREQQLMSREEEKSSVGTALLQGLSNDQGYQTAWLAQQRFPELVERGIDPVDYYFLDEDEDIAYIDPYSNEVVKEFKDNLLVDTARYVGPTAQFLGERGGGSRIDARGGGRWGGAGGRDGLRAQGEGAGARCGPVPRRRAVAVAVAVAVAPSPSRHAPCGTHASRTRSWWIDPRRPGQRGGLWNRLC